MNYILIGTGLASPVVAFVLAIAFYFGSDRGRTSGSSFLGYFGGWVGVAALVGLLVAALGRPLCVILQFGENSWPWVIPFFLVPFFASIAATTYCVFWVNAKFVAAPAPTLDLPPATEEVQFTDEEASHMQRWNIFSNGKIFRVGDLKFQTLDEALVAAKGLKNDGDGL
jgi:hypothetical protein